MVLGEPALVVPDDQAWTLWGADPYADGLRPVSDAASARRVVLPDRLPEPLAAALAELSEELPAGRRVEVRAAPALGGPRLERALGARPTPDGGREEEGGDEEGGHGDMMAITGAPGSDGLVMEPIDTIVGPLAGPLPGGLTVGVRLAGDVVEDCRVDALLHAAQPAPDRPPDPLAPSAWRAALATAAGECPAAEGWRAVAAVELERAVSHVAWLRAFARLLGWAALVEACTAALGPLGAARRGVRDGLPAGSDLDQGLGALASLRGAVGGRRMSVRTRGRAVVDSAAVGAHGLAGPLARATGVATDARNADGAYAALGFAPVVEADGDARARTVLRHAEAVAAAELAVAALAHDAAGHAVTPFGDGAGGALVEGPRGPLRARVTGGVLRLAAPGAHAARTVAARSAMGQEWAGALVCLASFDLSPWRVGLGGSIAREPARDHGGP
jgi:hypothetical protein